MTAKTSFRRDVHYTTLQAVFEDAQRLSRAGAPTSGTWSIEQIFEHLARVMEKSIDGFEASAPWPVRVLGKLVLKRKFLRDGLPAGFRLKGTAAEELIPTEIDSPRGLDHLRRAIERLETEEQRSVHPAFGMMDRDEWNRMHLRHAELHMSFIQEPQESTP